MDHIHTHWQVYEVTKSQQCSHFWLLLYILKHLFSKLVPMNFKYSLASFYHAQNEKLLYKCLPLPPPPSSTMCPKLHHAPQVKPTHAFWHVTAKLRPLHTTDSKAVLAQILLDNVKVWLWEKLSQEVWWRITRIPPHSLFHNWVIWMISEMLLLYNCLRYELYTLQLLIT